MHILFLLIFTLYRLTLTSYVSLSWKYMILRWQTRRLWPSSGWLVEALGWTRALFCTSLFFRLTSPENFTPSYLKIFRVENGIENNWTFYPLLHSIQGIRLVIWRLAFQHQWIVQVCWKPHAITMVNRKQLWRWDELHSILPNEPRRVVLTGCQLMVKKTNRVWEVYGGGF